MKESLNEAKKGTIWDELSKSDGMFSWKTKSKALPIKLGKGSDQGTEKVKSDDVASVLSPDKSFLLSMFSSHAGITKMSYLPREDCL